MNKKPMSSTGRRILTAVMMLVLVGQACTFSLFDSGGGTPTPATVVASPTPQVMAQINFVATLPEPLQPSETLAIAILDEVTGLSLNATQYPMNPRDALTYTASIPLPFNTVVKYRYVRRGASQVLEDANSGSAIRYRIYQVMSPSDVQDIIADWGDKSYARPTGKIEGHVFNSDTGSPLPNILVSAGGLQSFTDSTGSFELTGLPVGTQNLLAYSLDGMYQTFQQGAVVADGKNTSVDLRVKPAQLVNITFIVSVPAETVPGVPVRIAGNLLQLGNTFADLRGGISTNAERMPVLSLQADGRYSITLGLPVGADIQYKYTLGDGFWNAERTLDSQWNVREFIVPPQDVIIQDNVPSWLAGNSAPILFEASVPSVTPPGDIIYVQFNTFGWMEPLPMWPLGNNRWAYKLYGPLNVLDSFTYRYCRNGQCGSADDSQTVGAAPHGRQAVTSIIGQDIQDTISAWQWYESPEPVTLVGATIPPRTGGFFAGVEFQSTYRPNWSYYAPQAFANMQALGSNVTILTPSWTYTSSSPLQFSPVPGQDPMWIDSAIMISQARALGLSVALFPTPNFPASSSTFWLNAPRDEQWWLTWFARYRAFAINYADLATQTGAQTLILGGDWITPALPNGTLPDGNPSNVPADADVQWKSLIADVRGHFKGPIFWALPYTKSAISAPLDFLKDTDGIYLLWSAPLSTGAGATKVDYANEAGRLLDNEVAPLATLIGKPLILAVAYPSATQSATGCIPDGKGGCLDWTALNRPNADIESISLSLQTQADLYEAMLIALNTRPWVSGFISRGYYLPAALQDKSASVHSKPTSDILWYWYPRLTGAVK
ncbi:MAG: hypothetical protein HZB50_13800 [Chloroflexi bacterium]|nr:hypothetical protein [Chloroflexota bacterium]